MSVQEDGKPPPVKGGGSASSSAGSRTHPEDSTSPESGKRSTYRYSLVDDHTDNRPEARKSTLVDLAALLERHGESYEGKNGPGFLPATFDPPKRANDYVEGVHWLALDIEDTTGTVDGLQGPLTDYQRIVYSTWSHGDPSKWSEGEPRFRVLVPLERPVEPDEYRALWRHVYELLDEAPDAGCKDPARLMYTPRQRNPNATIDPWLELHEDGPTLNPDALPAEDGETVSIGELMARRKARGEGDDTPFDAPKSLDEAEWIADALEHIDPDVDYDRWRNIGIALKTAFGDEAFELFDTWSADGEKYEGPLDTRQKWESFPHQSPDEVAGDGITLGTIWHLATDAGWTPPENAYPGWSRPAPLDPYADVEPLDLEAARAKVKSNVDKLLERDEGRMYIQAEPGAGKTYSTLEAALDAWERGETVKYVTGTNDVLDEKRDALLEKGRERESIDFNELRENVQIEPKRTADNCARFDVYNAFNRTVEGGGHKFCQNCELHPDNQPDQSEWCDFIPEKWDAQEADPDMVLSTHTLETKSRGRPLHEETDRDLVFCWRRMLETFLDAQTELEGVPTRLEGYVDETDAQYRMKVRPAQNGAEPPELVKGDEYTLDEDGQPTATAAGKRRIRRWLADAAPVPIEPDPAELFGYYQATSTASEWDVMVVDESILSSALETVAVTFDDLSQWHEAGDLDGPEGWLESANEAFGAGACTNPVAVADRMPNSLEHCGNETGKTILSAALESEAGDRSRREAVEDAPDWRALELLDYYSRNGWTGCTIRVDEETEEEETELMLVDARRLDLEQADRVLVLDGTGDPVAAEATLEADHEYVSVPVKRPDSTTVQRVAWKLGRWALDEVDRKRHRALVEHPAFTTDDRFPHLHVTRKDYNPNVDYEERSVGADLEVAARRKEHVDELGRASQPNDRIIHLGGTETRGSNAYRQCSSVTLASFYVPPGAIRQRAAMLERLTRRDLEDCEQAATWQLDAAEIVQAAHRTRFLEGDTTVTYCDWRDLPGLAPERTLDPDQLDELAAEATGHLRNWHGDHVAARLLRELVEHADAPVFTDSPRGTGGISHCVVTSQIDPYCEVTTHLEIPDVKAALQTAFRNDWGRSWREAADAAGLHFARLETSKGGAGQCVLSSNPIDAETVADLVDEADPDWQWYEFDGERVRLDNVAAQLRGALSALPTPEWSEMTAKQKRAAVGNVLGISASTVYRRMREIEWSMEDLDDAWSDAHNGTFDPPDFNPDPEFSEAVEERAAIMEYHGDMSRDEAERRAPEAVELPDGGSDPPWDATTFEAVEVEADDLRTLENGEPWSHSERVDNEPLWKALAASRREAGYRAELDE